MSRNRIVFAAIALVAVLGLVAPAPARAAALPEGGFSMTGVLERAWSWLAGFVLPEGANPPGQGVWWEKEGAATNLDGRTNPGTAAPAPGMATSEEGGAIDPNGAK
jgi:hypothetical protein